MMATSTIMDSELRLNFETGVDPKGKPIIKSKNFKVKTTATTDQLHAVANALAALQQYPLDSIERNDSYSILV